MPDRLLIAMSGGSSSRTIFYDNNFFLWGGWRDVKL